MCEFVYLLSVSLLQLCRCTVRPIWSSCWTSPEVSVQQISNSSNPFYRSWSAGWISIAVIRALVLSRTRHGSALHLIWVHTAAYHRYRQPSPQCSIPEEELTRMRRLPMFVHLCWGQRQVTAATYLILLLSSLMETQTTDKLPRYLPPMLTKLW